MRQHFSDIAYVLQNILKRCVIFCSYLTFCDVLKQTPKQEQEKWFLHLHRLLYPCNLKLFSHSSFLAQPGCQSLVHTV